MVGRKASMCLRSSCSRTTCSWRDRVQSANHAPVIPRPRTRDDPEPVEGSSRQGLRPLRQRAFVRALQLVVAPRDRRLAAEPFQILGTLARHLLVGHTGADVAAGVIEGPYAGFGARLE